MFFCPGCSGERGRTPYPTYGWSGAFLRLASLFLMSRTRTSVGNEHEHPRRLISGASDQAIVDGDSNEQEKLVTTCPAGEAESGTQLLGIKLSCGRSTPVSRTVRACTE